MCWTTLSYTLVRRTGHAYVCSFVSKGIRVCFLHTKQHVLDSPFEALFSIYTTCGQQNILVIFNQSQHLLDKQTVFLHIQLTPSWPLRPIDKRHLQVSHDLQHSKFHWWLVHHWISSSPFFSTLSSLGSQVSCTEFSHGPLCHMPLYLQRHVFTMSSLNFKNFCV